MKKINKTKHTLLPLAAALVCLLVAGCDPEPKERQYHPTTEGTIVKGKVALIMYQSYGHNSCVAVNVTNCPDFGTTGHSDWCCAYRYSFEYNNTVLLPNPFNNDGEVMLDVPGADKLKKLAEGKTIVAVCTDTNQLPNYYSWDYDGPLTWEHVPLEGRKLSIREVLDVY